MFKPEKKKQLVPFARLFKTVSPKEFVILFNSETPQAKAFILSFSPRKNYIYKILSLLDSQESNEKDAGNRSSTVIREYFNQRQEDTLSLSFVRAVEKEVESMITEYENSHGLRNLRKRFFFKYPKRGKSKDRLI
jgi:hypothetical protein